MPLHEHMPIKVTLTVQVDGHYLTFEETSKAAGARYHALDPRKSGGYTSDDCLESKIRDATHECMVRVGAKATEFLTRAYPLFGDEHP